MEFYLVIHGHTEAEARGKICGGAWDLPLSDQGIKQAKSVARSLAKDKRKIRTIFSSPLLRCIQTTDVLHDVVKVKVRVISGLSERNLGIWERALMESVPEFSPVAEQIPGGENLNRFRARVKESIDHVVDSTMKNGGSALIVGHAFFGKVLLGLLALSDRELEPCTLYRFSRTGQSSPWQFEEI